MSERERGARCVNISYCTLLHYVTVRFFVGDPWQRRKVMDEMLIPLSAVFVRLFLTVIASRISDGVAFASMPFSFVALLCRDTRTRGETWRFCYGSI